MTILVTGGAGFIGANFVLDWLAQQRRARRQSRQAHLRGQPRDPRSLEGDARHVFVQGDIGDSALVDRLLAEHQPRAVVNFAAECHVDRSIHGPDDFVQTNVVGTFRLLEAVRALLERAAGRAKAGFRFLHVSTDEVYGSLARDRPGLHRSSTRYEPNSPYSASKAASDHLVRAWHHTYGLPVLTTNCSNNYGPYHFPEKLIPLMIVNALAGKPLPVYGDGMQVRDWLYVEDHCSAIRRVLEAGRLGETYNVGGWNEKPNIEIVHTVCALLDELRPRADGKQLQRRRSRYVKDRPGHDRRYAIDARKIERELGWKPAETFETGIRKTVQWYLDNAEWVRNVQSGAYRDWVADAVRRRRRARMKILLLGKSGQVGWELQRSLAPLGEVVALDFDSTDFCGDFSQPGAAAPRRCAACGPTSSSMPPRTPPSTRPRASPSSRARSTPPRPACWPQAAAAARRLAGALLAPTTSSTAAAASPGAKTTRPAPLSVYGRTKLEGEQLIARHCAEAPDLAHQLGLRRARRQLRQDHAAPGAGARAPDRDRRPVRRADRRRPAGRRHRARDSRTLQRRPQDAGHVPPGRPAARPAGMATRAS